MKTNTTTKHAIIWKSYVRLALVNMVAYVVSNICCFIDNIVIGRFLGEHALAAVGLFSPVLVLSGLAFVIIAGAEILIGTLIGAGKQDKVTSLFTSSFITIAFIWAAISIALLIARIPLAGLLGARGESKELLEQYIAGYSFNLLFAALSSLLISVASFNNAIKRSYIATTALFFCDVVFDVLFVNILGIFGVGLASTLSSLVAFLILLPAYTNKEKTVHIEKTAFDKELLAEAVRRGAPTLLFNIGIFVKNSLINYSLLRYVGVESIAVASVLVAMCGLVGAVTVGCYSAHSALTSLYYGEEDREGFIDVFKTALVAGVACTTLVVTFLAVFSSRLSDIFFSPGTEIYEMGRTMFTIGFWFSLFNVFLNLLMNSYKIQGRMKLVNIISFAEVAMIGILTLLTVPLWGSNGAWLANMWSDILSIIIVIISVFAYTGSADLSIPSLLKLPPDFGASKEEFEEYSVQTKEEVSEISQKVIDFCRSRDIDHKKALWVGLCIEELAVNIIDHGGFKRGHNSIAIRVVNKEEGELTVRIQDDCIRFDPRSYLNMFNTDSPEEHIGLRMVAKLVDSINYYNNAGINTLIMKL
ncbi:MULTISPECIES: MATE family efflux transporter [unclassified Butyrivibrio]|uniref:MATE family efflux transporter n=1 Tax=unclassified Butyrivibrio TaxID=2639466 RepID=UPI0005D25F83|nr:MULTISPECIES: MATE family efflux transporter [unclassified Butyrivibrio]SEK78876.1 Na+-driven multidrug efflux pump [Butyrivibrio sp. ob235]